MFYSTQNKQPKGSPLTLLSVILLVTTLISCGGNNETQTSSKRTTAAPLEHPTDTPNDAGSISSTLWVSGLKNIQQSIKATEKLSLAITQLLDTPTPETLQLARNEWQKAYNAAQGILLLLYINDDNSLVLDALEKWRFAIAPWPIQPGYIDSYGEHQHSGIVHDFTLSINRSTIRKQHGILGNEEAVLGFHAIEFMLWGENGKRLIDSLQAKTQLPSSYRKAKLTLKDLPNNRRRQLLAIQSQLLVNDLQTLNNQWQSNQLLSLAYFQLAPAERLNAINNSIKSYLQTWSIKLENATAEVSPEISIDAFSQQHLPALQHGINAITNLYFAKQPNLADQLLSDFIQGKVRTHLEDIITLTEEKHHEDSTEQTEETTAVDIQSKVALFKKIDSLITLLSNQYTP